jgi:hypothetical protein
MSGQVHREFLPRRTAQRYVEIMKKSGKDGADTWWKSFQWFPSDEEFKEFQDNIKKLIGG